MMSYFFTTLCHCLGQWQSVGGGPNCPLRWFPKPGALGTRFLRAWRLQTTDRDSLLLLGQMIITALAHQARGQQVVHSVLEHPNDWIAAWCRPPAATKCSSIFLDYRSICARGHPSFPLTLCWVIALPSSHRSWNLRVRSRSSTISFLPKALFWCLTSSFLALASSLGLPSILCHRACGALRQGLGCGEHRCAGVWNFSPLCAGTQRK